MIPKNHKIGCQCGVCKAIRGETNGDKNAFFGKHHSKEIATNAEYKKYKYFCEVCNVPIIWQTAIKGSGKCGICSRIGKKKSIETRKRISISKRKNPTRYWLNKSNKDVIVKHHIDGNKKNNIESNFLQIKQDLHRSLHFRGYDYIVKLGLIKDYIREFLIKYDFNFLIDDGKLVHHIDGNRENNQESNLMYVPNRGLHNKLHQEAYLYLVKIKEINNYIKWFLSTERKESHIIYLPEEGKYNYTF